MFKFHIVTDENMLVPLAGSRYYFDKNFTLFDQSDRIVTPFLSNGEKYVTIDWLDGLKPYNLAVLVLLTFKPIHVPFTHWHKLSALYKDNDPYNIHPSNLVWKFPPEGIEHVNYPGFYYIPGFTRSLMNRDGVVINTETKKLNSLNRVPDRYILTSVKPDVPDPNKRKRTVNYGQHRLLGLTFLEYPGNVDRLVVNHKNGVKSDNRLENLEWITKREDILHAIRTGLRDNTRAIVVKNVNTGIVTEYSSVVECGRDLGILRSLIQSRLACPKFIIWPDKYIFKDKDDPRDFDEAEAVFMPDGYNKPILVRNVKTNEVMRFESLSECSVKFNLSVGGVSLRISKYDQAVYPGYYQFKFDDGSPWREPEDLEKEHEEAVFKENKPVIPIMVRNLKTGEEFTLPTLKHAFRFFKKDLRKALRKNRQLVYPGYYQVKLQDSNPWRDPIDLEAEHTAAIARELKNGTNQQYK